MAKWDIARETVDCRRCQGPIGAGEAARVSKVAGAFICEECSIALDGETAPEHLDSRSFLERVRDDIAQAAPRSKPGFARITTEFDPAELSATARRELESKAGPHSVQPGRQPSFDPRGQRRRPSRHGVVEAVRDTSQTDWRWRAIGERDE